MTTDPAASAAATRIHYSQTGSATPSVSPAAPQVAKVRVQGPDEPYDVEAGIPAHGGQPPQPGTPHPPAHRPRNSCASATCVLAGWLACITAPAVALGIKVGGLAAGLYAGTSAGGCICVNLCSSLLDSAVATPVAPAHASNGDSHNA